MELKALEASPIMTPPRSQSVAKVTRSSQKFIVKTLIKGKTAFTPSTKRGFVYTIAKKYVGDPNEAKPVPGSLEEDIVLPENFFEPRRNSVAIQPSASSSEKQWASLNPTDVFARAAASHKRRGSLQFEDEEGYPDTFYTRKNTVKRSYRSIDNTSSKDVTRYLRRYHKRIEIDDQDLLRRYDDIRQRITQYYQTTPTLFSRARSIAEFNATKQERFFENYAKTQTSWGRNLWQTCSKVGRSPEESVINRAQGYREKIEKARALEMLNPSALIYGAQGWSLSLRKSPHENRHYAIPMGNSYGGLWVQITESPHKQLEIVRSLSSKRFREKKSSKGSPLILKNPRVNEILPVKDETVVGKSALEVEIEGVKASYKPKCVNTNPIQFEEEPESENI